MRTKQELLSDINNLEIEGTEIKKQEMALEMRKGKFNKSFGELIQEVTGAKESETVNAIEIIKGALGK